MLLRQFEEPATPVREAEENLRVIRNLMERSTKYSTFSGLSGVFAGVVSILGCLVHRFVVIPLPTSYRPIGFVANWSTVIALAVGVDFLLTKRRAARVGKLVLSRLGKQMLLASIPGLGTGVLLTLFFLRHGLMEEVFPFWMLMYGIAVCAVGLFSQREVSRLGWAFLSAGLVTLAIQTLEGAGGTLGLWMIGVSFGGFHIAYGIAASRRHGW